MRVIARCDGMTRIQSFQVLVAEHLKACTKFGLNWAVTARTQLHLAAVFSNRHRARCRPYPPRAQMGRTSEATCGPIVRCCAVLRRTGRGRGSD